MDEHSRPVLNTRSLRRLNHLEQSTPTQRLKRQVGTDLLLHLGSEREDKMPPHVGPLLDELIARGYSFARVDELLGAPQTGSP